MKKCSRIISWIVLVSFLTSSTLLFSSHQNFPIREEEHEIILNLRKEFKYALKDSKKNAELIELVEGKYQSDPLTFPATILAYYGALIGLRAKHAFFPNEKLRYLIKSLQLMDEAVKKDDAELETHFLRFSSLHHMPSVLSIPRKRREDISRIIELLQKRDVAGMDPSFQLVIIDFMLQSMRLNKEQSETLGSMKKIISGQNQD
ncbi:MAG: hypothetical protein JW847_02175 [Candidatus Omnitrophica bacterium]|nr:hypothetical protein [Candidatus Omnitrophota bacterium]